MSQKMSIDIELNAQKYKDGARQATQSTKDLQKATEEFVTDYGSLRKQLASTKKEAQNLAGAFASLSATEKKSEFGKEIKAQLDIAIEKAAELQDVMGDTAQAIKNASSDTQTWDAFKEGFEVAKSAAMTYASAIAKVTGNEEDLAKLVKTLTMLENGFNTVIKVGNALQQQSAIMTGIRKVQLLAAAKAEEIGAAATGKATIAQKAFNAVAKANPYVLLATAAVAAAAAIGGYMLATKKATKEDEISIETKKKLEDIENQYKDTVVKSAGEQIAAYKKLQVQWGKLKTEMEKTQFIKIHGEEMRKLGGNIKSVSDAEKFLVTNSSSVVQGMIARAKAAARAAMAQQYYSEALAKQMELEELQAKRTKELSEVKGDKKTTTSFTTSTGAVISNTFVETVGQQRAAIYKKYKSNETQLQKDIVALNNKGNKLIKESAEGLADIPSVKNDIKSGTEKSTTKPVEAEFKVLPVPSLDKDFDKKLKDLVKDTNAKTQEAFDKSKVEVNTILNSPLNIQQAKNKISNAERVPVELDFEIPENMSKEIEGQRNELDHLVEALSIAEAEKINFANAGDVEGVAAMTEQIDRLTESYNENATALENSLAKAEKIAEVSEGFKKAGETVGAFGDMFTALGEATDSAGLKVMGIIAQAIATIALSFAQALASCKTWIDWLIFGVTGMTTMITMITQIKNLTAGGFAQGGIVPGNSYSGDRLIASVNSGEIIMNRRQQNRLMNILNGIEGVNGAGGGLVVTSVKVKGTDLILAINNTLKTNKKQTIG